MARRAVVFVLAVLLSVVVGFFVRRSELEAAQAGRLWPGRNELRAQDTLLRLRPVPSPRPDVVIVAADDASVKKYGKLPWSRTIWAQGLRQVQAGGAKVAVFDTALERRTTKAADEALWRRMANGRRTVLGMGYDTAQTPKWTPDDVRALRFLEKFALADRITLRGSAAVTPFQWAFFEPPVSDFTQSARGVGVFLRETDQDGIVRHARMLYLSKVQTPKATAPLPPRSVPPPKLENATVALPNLALTAARQTFQLDKTNLRAEGDTVRFDGELGQAVVIPVDSASRMVINYAGPGGSFQRISFADVATGRVPTASFRGKVVLFGVTASGEKETDNRLTPQGEMPRVEITANAIASILSRSYIARARGNDVLATLVVVGVVAGLLLAAARPLSAFLLGVGLSLLYLIVAWCLLTFMERLLPVLPALLALAAITVIAVACALIFGANQRRAGY